MGIRQQSRSPISMVKPNDVALSVPAWLLCYMWHVFQLVVEVAMS